MFSPWEVCNHSLMHLRTPLPLYDYKLQRWDMTVNLGARQMVPQISAEGKGTHTKCTLLHTAKSCFGALKKKLWGKGADVWDTSAARTAPRELEYPTVSSGNAEKEHVCSVATAEGRCCEETVHLPSSVHPNL